MTREEYCSKIGEAKEAFSASVGNFISCEPYGNGHINDTFLAICEKDNEKKRYILQRINTFVFPSPENIMENITRVTEHIRARSDDKGRSTLTVIKDSNKESMFRDSIGSCWRMYTFVENTVSKDKVEEPYEFYKCAKAFGRFQNMLSDFPAKDLHEAISDFHNTPKRYENLEIAIAKNASGRADMAKDEIEFARERSAFTRVLDIAHAEGKLPLRVTHNDTKLNNILFDASSGEPACVIDLDTVMPGYSVNDFGDSIRFGANTAAEDEKDLSLVTLDMDLFELYAKGFIEETRGKLSDEELSLLPYGAMMMTFECGMRFLTDYIDGDTYFRTHYPEHNLVRCRNQFKLLSDMENKLDLMKNTVNKLLNA